jgi:hypothetical protein
MERSSAGQLVHGDMHGRETKHGANRNSDEKPLPELEERHSSGDASAGNVSDEVVQEGRYRVVTDRLRRTNEAQARYLYTVMYTPST